MKMFEKVNKFHPDKVADRIAGAIVDLAYTKQNNPKVAVEVLIGHGEANVIVESSVDFAEKEIVEIVQRIDDNITKFNIKCVPQDVHLACNQNNAIRCGDNGIFVGVPTNECENKLTEITKLLEDQYHSDGKLVLADDTLTICQSNMPADDYARVWEFIALNYPEITTLILNPLGQWTGGTDVDTGATNRKLGSDMGRAVSGGGLHGKDLSKADTSINIYLYLLSARTEQSYQAKCSIGDEMVTIEADDGYRFSVPYERIVNEAKQYVKDIGGFEKFAEYGLIRPSK